MCYHTQKDIINSTANVTISASLHNQFFFSVLSVEAMGEPIVVSSLGIILVSMNNKEINLYDDYTEK